MINWYEIARIPNLVRLVEILRRQLNLWVGVLTKSGVVTYLGQQQIVDKPLCELFMSRSDSGSCSKSYQDWFTELDPELKTCLFLQCHAGMRGVVAPIVLDGSVIAAVFASGFFPNNSGANEEAEVFLRGQELGLNRSHITHGYRENVRLHQREAQLLADILRELAGIIETYLGHEHQSSPSQRTSVYDYSQIVGKSPAMKQLFQLLDKVVESESSVLIQGPPGVGKELVARAIHYNGPRANEAFVVQNCSALNDSLLDSELFGHKRGAFTGAYIDKPGLFEVADKGTFFLDEIGDMSPALQVKLLRVLQEGTFVPVGDSVTRHVDVRIITATNRNLEEMVENGSFRKDLYYRINVLSINVPSLAERREDILSLLNYFIEKKCHENGFKLKKISNDAVRALLQYDWPGNVRELENEVERIVVLSSEDEPIPLNVLSPRISRISDSRETPVLSQTSFSQSMDSLAPGANLPETLESIEKTMIYNALERNDWNKTKTAEELGVSRRNLIRKVDRYQLDEIRTDETEKL